MFPLILTGLSRDYNKGVLQSLLRTVRIRGNIPSPGVRGPGGGWVGV